MGRVVHDPVRRVVLQVKVEDANDVWMHQVAQKSGLGEEILTAERTGLGMQDFDGHAGIEIEMLGQVDIGKDARAELVQEIVVPQALSHTVHALLHQNSVLDTRLRSRGGRKERRPQAERFWYGNRSNPYHSRIAPLVGKVGLVDDIRRHFLSTLA